MTLFAYAMAVLLFLVAPVPVVEPKVDAQCLQSPVHLGTDNVPNSNETSTSIIDIAAYVLPQSGKPVAWLYKNRLGQRWLQTNLRERSTLRGALAPTQYARYTRGDVRLGEGSNIVRVMSRDLAALGTSLARSGIQSRRCFSRPLP